jgi:hypothetical protein
VRFAGSGSGPVPSMCPTIRLLRVAYRPVSFLVDTILLGHDDLRRKADSSEHLETIELNTKYFPPVYRLHAVERYLVWISNESDSVAVDAGEFVPRIPVASSE